MPKKLLPHTENTDQDDGRADSDGDPDERSTGQGEAQENLVSSRLPGYPHPSVDDLEELSFDLLPENFFVIVYGARRTGKTYAISCLLDDVKDRFDFAYLFSATALLHKNEEGELDFDMIRDEAKFQGFDEGALKRIIERQKAVKEHNNSVKSKSERKPNKTLIIFDDFVHEKGVRFSKIFTELPVLGRHYELSVICLSQGYSAVGSSGLNPATRQNADMVVTFLPRNINDVERISMWYLAKPKLEGMWFVRSVCEEKHRCLGIDLTQPHLTEFEEHCYMYTAPSKVPKYELGKVQWKLYREEMKRQKKAALAAKLENDRYFFLGTVEMEKRAKIGEATGLPDRRGKLTLFDAARAMT